MIDDLKSLVAVIDEASLTKAADVLCISQSAVSKRIQRLEELLGAELFDRKSKPPMPNSLARRVYEEALPLLNKVERLLMLARESSPPSGTFRLGLPQALADIALIDLVTCLKSEFPELNVRLHTDWSPGLQRMIESGALDAAVIMLPAGAVAPDGAASLHIATLDMLVVQSKRKPLVKRGNTIKALAALDWILNPLGCGYRAALERAMNDMGMALRLSVDTHGSGTQLQLVAAGFGLGLVPEQVFARSGIREDLQVVETRDFKLSVDLRLLSQQQLGNLKRAVDVVRDVGLKTFQQRPAEPASRLQDSETKNLSR